MSMSHACSRLIQLEAWPVHYCINWYFETSVVVHLLVLGGIATHLMSSIQVIAVFLFYREVYSMWCRKVVFEGSVIPKMFGVHNEMNTVTSKVPKKQTCLLQTQQTTTTTTTTTTTLCANFPFVALYQISFFSFDMHGTFLTVCTGPEYLACLFINPVRDRLKHERNYVSKMTWKAFCRVQLYHSECIVETVHLSALLSSGWETQFTVALKVNFMPPSPPVCNTESTTQLVHITLGFTAVCHILLIYRIKQG